MLHLMTHTSRILVAATGLQVIRGRQASSTVQVVETKSHPQRQ